MGKKIKLGANAALLLAASAPIGEKLIEARRLLEEEGATPDDPRLQRLAQQINQGHAMFTNLCKKLYGPKVDVDEVLDQIVSLAPK